SHYPHLHSFPTRRSSDLFRAGGFSSARRDKIFDGLARWGSEVKSLRQSRSNGPVTARAAVFFNELDREIRQKSAGRYRLDHLLRDRKSTRLNSSHVKISY